MKITTTRHHRVPCSQCLTIVRTDSGIQADRARRLTEAGVSVDEVERLLPTCPRCLRRRLRDLAVLEVMLQDFSAGGDVRSIAKSLGMRPWSVIASIGRLEGEGKLRGEWGWDRARRCLRWQGTPPTLPTLDGDQEEGGLIEDAFRGKVRWLGYDPERTDVFIPTNICAKWYNQATGETKKATGVSTSLRQLYDEGKMTRLLYYRRGGSGERGFRWVGERVGSDEPTQFDLAARLAKKMSEQQSSKDGEYGEADF